MTTANPNTRFIDPVIRLHLACLTVVIASMLQPHAVGATDRGAGWTTYSHPCPGGNRTDALHVDDDGRMWVGCGSNASGYGLFTSEDGSVWSAASVTPTNKFAQFRVSSITRGHDEALYVAGVSAITGNREMVLRVDTSVVPSPVTATLVGVNQVGRTFHVGNYRELSDGRAMAEDLNGTSVLYRPDAATGSSAANWLSVGGSHQILDLTVVHGSDYFTGSGSRINEPPRLFLPPDDPVSEPWEFESFILPTATNWVGELWGVTFTQGRLIAVGVDQDQDIGKIFVSSSDPYDPDGYSELDLPDFIEPGPGSGTWARGVCANAGTVVVVGERQPLSSSSGLVLISHDAGETFVDITPDDVTGSVSNCVMDKARVIVAGAGGFIGIRPTDDTIFRNGFQTGGSN